MSYHRHGRSLGDPRSGYVAVEGMGAIEDLGLGPQITGNPVVALYAQLNRFAGKRVTAGSGCQAKTYLTSALPLASGISHQAATAALIIVYDRYNCVPIDVYSKNKALWASGGLENPVAFVGANLTEIVTTIAQFGDSLGYPPASVGITERDPKFAAKVPFGLIAVIGGLGLLALVVSRRR